MSIRAYSVGRNGMPERVNYVYRGTGEDQMPYLGEDDLKPYKGETEPYLPDFPRGSSKPSGKCEDCGYKPASPNHKILCVPTMIDILERERRQADRRMRLAEAIGVLR